MPGANRGIADAGNGDSEMSRAGWKTTRKRGLSAEVPHDCGTRANGAEVAMAQSSPREPWRFDLSRIARYGISVAGMPWGFARAFRDSDTTEGA